MLNFKIDLKGLICSAFEVMEKKKLRFSSGLGGKIVGEEFGTRGYLTYINIWKLQNSQAWQWLFTRTGVVIV